MSLGNLPSDLVERITARLPQPHLRSLGRTGRAERAAADAVHAARQARATAARAGPAAGVLSRRRLAQLVVAAVARAEAASRLVTDDRHMRRAGFEADLYEDHVAASGTPARTYGAYASTGSFEIQTDLYRTAGGYRFDVVFLHPSLGGQVQITGGARLRSSDGKPALTLGMPYDPPEETTVEGAAHVAEIVSRLQRLGYAVYTADRPVRPFVRPPPGTPAPREPRWAAMMPHRLHPYFPTIGPA
jgi:hypothetical protein